MLDKFKPGVGLVPSACGAAFMRIAKQLLESLDPELSPDARAQAVAEQFPLLLTRLYASFGIISGDGTVLRPATFMQGGKPTSDQFWVLLPTYVTDSITLVVVRTPPLAEITHFNEITYGGVYFWHHPEDLYAGGIGVEGEVANVYSARAIIVTRGLDYIFNMARKRFGSDHRTAALGRINALSRDIFVSIRDLVEGESQ